MVKHTKVGKKSKVLLYQKLFLNGCPINFELGKYLLGFYLLWTGLPGIGRALGAENVKFFGQVLPKAKKVVYKLDLSLIHI